MTTNQVLKRLKDTKFNLAVAMTNVHMIDYSVITMDEVIKQIKER
jgi:hypothetical protein